MLARNLLSSVVKPDPPPQFGPEDQQQRPSALAGSLLPRSLLRCLRAPGVARRAGVVVDRRHHQYDLHPPAGHRERHRRLVAFGGDRRQLVLQAIASTKPLPNAIGCLK